MKNNFTVDILSPSKIAAKDIPAESLLVPTTAGQINILAGHTHIVTKLDTGVLAIFGGPDDPDRFFAISDGVCKILDQKIVILTETCEESKEIDVELASEAAEHAAQVLKSESLSPQEVDKMRRKLQWAQLKLQLAAEYQKKKKS